MLNKQNLFCVYKRDDFIMYECNRPTTKVVYAEGIALPDCHRDLACEEQYLLTLSYLKLMYNVV